MPSLLSVALCTFNGGKYLDQQLNSIINQTKTVDEITICDDGSTDNTIEIIKKFQGYSSINIKLYLNNTSLGAIKNFEKAIGLCKGDIIFLSDQDDIWEENKVEKIIRKFEENPLAEAVFSDGEMVNDNNIPLKTSLWDTLNFNSELKKSWTSGAALIDLVYGRNIITGATLAIKKDLYLRATPFPLFKAMWHDGWLGLHSAVNNTLTWVDEPLIKYRIHANQQVGIGNGITFANNVSTKIKLKDVLLDNKEFYLNCLLIVDKVTDQYTHIDKTILKKEALAKLDWISIRLKLPKNIFLRFFYILSNIKFYKIYSNNLLKTIIKDILGISKQ